MGTRLAHMRQTYSFSKVTTFEQCPLQYKFRYIERLPELPNYYSELGSFMHLLLELHDRRKTKNLAALFWKYYDKRVVSPCPFPHESKWKLELYNQFNSFKGFSKKAIGIEHKFNLDFGKYDFRGFIDRIVVGAIIDYKVSNPYNKDKLIDKKKQLVLYSKAYKELTGSFPKKLYFYYFRKNVIQAFDFDENEYNEAVDWLNSLVAKIETEKEFTAKPEKGFCSNLCGYRNICKFKIK